MSKDTNSSPQQEQEKNTKVYVKFLNDDKTLLEIGNVRNSKTFSAISNMFGQSKDSFESFRKNGKFTIEPKQGVDERRVYSVALGGEMDRAREVTSYGKLEKAFKNGEDTSFLAKKYALAFIINKEFLNDSKISDGFTARFDKFAKANGSNKEALDSHEKLLSLCYDSVQEMTALLEQQQLIKTVPTTGNKFLALRTFEKTELTALANDKEVDITKESLAKVVSGATEKSIAYKAVKEGSVNTEKEETKKEEVSADTTTSEEEKPKTKRKASTK